MKPALGRPPRLLLQLLGRQVLLVGGLLVVEDEVQRVRVELGENFGNQAATSNTERSAPMALTRISSAV